MLAHRPPALCSECRCPPREDVGHIQDLVLLVEVEQDLHQHRMGRKSRGRQKKQMLQGLGMLCQRGFIGSSPMSALVAVAEPREAWVAKPGECSPVQQQRVCIEGGCQWPRATSRRRHLGKHTKSASARTKA